MIGLLFNSFFRSGIGLPCAILSSIAAVFAICGCVQCAKCRLRDCPCIKRLLLWSGQDEFDDFELVILVHKLFFDKDLKKDLAVRATAGREVVTSDYAKHCIFQQPLSLNVEQGTERVKIDIIDRSRQVIATLSLDVVNTILYPAKGLEPEMIYRFKEKSSLVSNPRAQLTMHVKMEEDAEMGFGSETDILLRQHMKKAKEHIGKQADAEQAHIEVLKESCAGPLERIQDLGSFVPYHVGVLGPPTSRHWILGLWNSQEAYEAKKRAILEMDVMRIQSVQPDPQRLNVFLISYMDDRHNKVVIFFRRVDRNRDVWVQCLKQLIETAREWKKKEKSQRQKSKFRR